MSVVIEDRKTDNVADVFLVVYCLYDIYSKRIVRVLALDDVAVLDGWDRKCLRSIDKGVGDSSLGGAEFKIERNIGRIAKQDIVFIFYIFSRRTDKIMIFRNSNIGYIEGYIA